MKLTIINDGPWILDGSDDFLEKKIHLVCIAVNALTQFGVYAKVIGGLSNELAENYVNKVNEKNETGTLYPKLNLTIMPLTIFEGRDDTNQSLVMEKHIIDCFDSNEKYTKCPKLIFALERRGDFDIDLAFKTLSALIDKYKFNFTKEIEFYNN
jgi:hypothetical protein